MDLTPIRIGSRLQQSDNVKVKFKPSKSFHPQKNHVDITETNHIVNILIKLPSGSIFLGYRH
jgi:hypothetical protein